LFGSSLPLGVCRRARVLFVRLHLQLLVGGLMYFCSSFPPVVCRRARVLFVRLCLQLLVGGSCIFVRLYLQLFVGGLMSCLFVFTSSCL
jgi:hypothetical protein